MKSETMERAPVHKWWVFAAVGVGAFMAAFSGSVVNATLPLIQRDLAADVATIEWVVTVYLVLVSGLLLSFGRVGDLRGHGRVYMAGFGVFVIGSALCATATTVGQLIAFRGLQALGGAMLFATSPAILTGSFPAAERGRVLGLQAMLTYLGLTAGPSVGGWLARQYGWQAIFLFNVPVGLVALGLSLRFVPRGVPVVHGDRFDWAGAVTFMAGLSLLLLALNRGHDWGWLTLRTLALLAFAGLILALFVRLERRPGPMLDLSLFRRRLFSTATASAMLNYICLYSIMFLLPFYLIQGRGLDTAQAGLILMAQPIVMAIAAPLSGALSDRIGSRLLSTAGMAILSLGLLLLAMLGPVSPVSQVVAALAVAGLGTGIFISPNTSALMGAAPRDRQGIAAAVMATARNLGMALGVGLAGAIFTTVLASAAGGAGASAAEPVIFAATRASFLVAAVLALVGVGDLSLAWHDRGRSV